MSLREHLRRWLDERLRWDDLIQPLVHKTVPVHRFSYWYFLGGMTLFLFVVQVCTGILLLLYFKPSSEQAFESVQYIMTQVHFGWLVRSIHAWSANLMIFTAFAHMFSVLFLGAYRKPRELTWISGVLLLFLVLGFGFSGYLLPWNARAFFATDVGTNMAAQVPWIGPALRTFLRGGDEVTGSTLTRFFGFHVALLPGIATLLLAIHLALIQRQGISVPPSTEDAWKVDPAKREEIRFFPDFLLRELMAWYIAIGALGALAALAPWGLGTRADPFASAPAGIKPEWYYLFMYETLRLIPARLWIVTGEVVGIVAFGAVAIFWTFLPFFNSSGRGRARHLILGIGVFAVVYIGVMTVAGYLAK